MGALHSSNDGLIPADLAIYVHLPYCRSLCWYCGCNKVVTRHDAPLERYLDALCAEIDLLAPALDDDRRVRLLQLGGGTPNSFDSAALQRLLDHLRQRFPFAPDADLGIELDPRLCSVEQLCALRELGFNRISFGIQDLDPAVQAAIHRVQPAETVLPLISAAAVIGFASINVDLVCGLPLQSEASLSASVRALAAAGAQRFALFEYAHLPRVFPAQKLLEAHPIPQAEQSRDLMHAAAEGAGGRGFLAHRPGSLRPAAGPAARGARAGQAAARVSGLFLRRPSGPARPGRVRNQRYRRHLVAERTRCWRLAENGVRDGQPAWARGRVRSAEDTLRACWIESLMCYGYVRREDAYGDWSPAEVERVWAQASQALEAHFAGSIHVDPDEIAMPESQWDRLREAALCFDAYRVAPRRVEPLARASIRGHSE